MHLTARPEGAPSRLPLAMVMLLGAALLINYVDRGTISTASPLIKSEFRLDDFQMGLLLSAFFATYVLSQPLMGILVDRIGAARVLAGGFTLWSAGTFLAGLSGGVLSLVALRLVMGVGESVCYPSGFALISQRVGDAHRARATSIMQLGSVVGPAVHRATLAAGEQRGFFWTVRAGTPGMSRVLVSAECAAGSDASLKPVPVLRS